MKKTTAVIVARKGSIRVPGKMYQMIDSEPLILRKIRQLKELESVEMIIVGTDADDFRGQIEDAGARFCRTPDEYNKGMHDKVNGMVRNILGFFKTEQVLWAHSTNPFIESWHYQEALEVLEAVRHEGYDSLFSVNRMMGHFWSDKMSPINFGALDPVHRIANHLPPVYAQNGGIFIRPYDDMLKDGSLIAGKAHMFPMDQLTGWDIDYPWQLEFAQHYASIINKKHEGIFE